MSRNTKGIGMRPLTVKTYDKVVVTNGARMNGIPNTGFITIGAPKIIGSLMLNSPGKIDNRPKLFKYFDLENMNKTTKAKVVPAPPIHTYHCKNCSVKIFGIL